MSYKLTHTAEAIDYKLNLIEKNKNLLPYPYVTNLTGGLDDVGDGSILTSNVTTSEKRVLLNTCLLPAGKNYTISLDIANILEEAVANPGFALEIDYNGNSISTANDANNTIKLDLVSETEATSIIVYLIAPSAFAVDLVIKPQIEEGDQKTKWVPYMNTIGNYVDERFNSTNAKIKVLTKLIAEAIGLPDPAGLSDGSILVVRNGTWAIEAPFEDSTILVVEEE